MSLFDSWVTSVLRIAQRGRLTGGSILRTWYCCTTPYFCGYAHLNIMRVVCLVDKPVFWPSTLYRTFLFYHFGGSDVSTSTYCTSRDNRNFRESARYIHTSVEVGISLPRRTPKVLATVEIQILHGSLPSLTEVFPAASINMEETSWPRERRSFHGRNVHVQANPAWECENARTSFIL